MTEEQKTKKCPYCGEEILEAAKKCKFCGQWLEECEKSNKPQQINHINQNVNYYIPKSKSFVNCWEVISLISVGGIALLMGLCMLGSADSAVHEIEGALFILIACVCYMGICLIKNMQDLRK